MDGGEKIPLSVVRPCGMGAPSVAFDMSGSLHLIIGSLLNGECKGLKL